MPSCPRCNQPVSDQAITCPICRTSLKAFGHPGIPLYQATGKDYLCQTCTYHHDDTCNFPQRPYAKECTLYYNQAQHNSVVQSHTHSWQYSIGLWFKRNAGWLVLIGLIVASLLIALSGK